MEISEFLIYGIKHPITNKFLYIGQSSQWLIRPRQHLNHPAQNTLLRKEIQALRESGAEPIIEVVENVYDRTILTDREKFWITKMLSDGHPLCNFQFAGKHPASCPRRRGGKTDLANKIKKIRYELDMDQKTFAEHVGIGLSTLRKLEQGKVTIHFESLADVLSKCGYHIEIIKSA